MRILYIYGYCGLGGVEVNIINKMKLLDISGIYSEAILVNVWTEGGEYILKYPRIKGGLSKEEIKEELKKNYDIITVIDYPQIFLLVEELHISSKIIYETHNSILSELKDSYAAISHPRISSIIVPSKFNKEQVDKFVMHNKRIDVVSNPVDMNLFKNTPISSISSEYKKFEDKINIIWVGRMDKNKNLIELILMGNLLLRRRKDLNFLIIGDTSCDKEYFNYAKKRIPQRYKSNYTFLEFVANEKMPEIYSLAANTGGCLVSTSINESQPMIIIEAMACKCPVISSGVGGTKELIKNNVTGKLYKLYDIVNGYLEINRIIGKAKISLRESIIDNAFSLVSSNHSFERVAERYKKILSITLSDQKSIEVDKKSQEGKKKSIYDASVIIPSYNRKDLLYLSLHSFNIQNYDADRFEVIVIDDGSIDGTYEMLNNMSTKYKLTVLHNAENLGAATARNQGVKAANSDIIIFSDSDCVVPNNFVEGHLKYHRNNNTIAVCGVISWRKVFSMYFEEFNNTQKKEFEHAKNNIPKFKQRIEDIDFYYKNNTRILSKKDIEYIDEFSYFPDWSEYFLKEVINSFGDSIDKFEYPWTFFGTGNVSIKKSVFNQAERFDTKLPREEDWDLGYRLYKSGLKFIVAPEVESIHQEHTISDVLQQKMIDSYKIIFSKYNDPEIHLFCLFNQGALDLVNLSKGVTEYKRLLQNKVKFNEVIIKFHHLLEYRKDAYLMGKKQTNKFQNINKELLILNDNTSKSKHLIILFREISRIYK